jgi:hypothetical protein
MTEALPPAPTVRVDHVQRSMRITVSIDGGDDHRIKAGAGLYRPDQATFKYDAVGAAAWLLRSIEVGGPKLRADGGPRGGRHQETIYQPANLPDWLATIEAGIRPTGGLAPKHTPHTVITAGTPLRPATHLLEGTP